MLILQLLSLIHWQERQSDLSGATFSGNIKLGDNNRLKFGNSDDLQIYHDGNNSIIREFQGQGNFILKVVEQLQSEIRIKVQ